MGFWEIILIIFLILICAAYLGVVIYFIVLWFVANKKPKGDKLKKARSKTIKREYNNEIKRIIKNCSKEFKDGSSYFSVCVRYKYFDTIKNNLVSWCEVNNIDYDWTDYDNGLGITIRIDFKEGVKLC